VATGLVQAAGLEVPELGGALTARLRDELPPSAAVTNPIDLAGGGEQDITSFERTTGALLGSGEVDAVLISGWFGGYGRYGADMAARELAVADALAAAAQTAGRPVVVHSMHPTEPASVRLRAAGVPVYGAIERAVRALAAAAPTPEAVALEPLPAPAAPIAGDGYEAARELLSAAGVPFAAQRTVTGAEAALAAAEAIGYPVVLKALGLLHKSDAGGVALGLRSAAELEDAFARMEALLHAPGYVVERMADLSAGVELIVGVQRDPRFGPVAMVGLGGVLTEVLRDVAFALAPVDEATARRLLERLAGAPLLRGVRGRPGVDLGAVAAVVATVSRLAAARPALASLEVNPVLAGPHGALALDARVVLDPEPPLARS
jgi:acyl-CoA synthetase (NDP forming)